MHILDIKSIELFIVHGRKSWNHIWIVLHERSNSVDYHNFNLKMTAAYWTAYLNFYVLILKPFLWISSTQSTSIDFVKGSTIK